MSDDIARLLGLPHNWREIEQRAYPLACGTNGGRWHIYCDDPEVLPRWWTLDDTRGRIRRFKTHAAALKVLSQLNLQAEVLKYAKVRADLLRGHLAYGERHWGHINRWPGCSASLWGADPFGLFTADLVLP